jgi:hypothetical protein
MRKANQDTPRPEEKHIPPVRPGYARYRLLLLVGQSGRGSPKYNQGNAE